MNRLKPILFKIAEVLLHLLYFLPINKNKVVFHATNGEKYHCNPKYLSEYIVKNCPEDFKIVWIFNHPAQYAFLKKQGVTVCKANSLSAVFHLMTAKFIIDNIFPISYIPYRKKQYVINTWHGGGSYKKGNINEPKHRQKHSEKIHSKVNYLIASCARYQQRQIQNGTVTAQQVLPYGMARSDIFFYDYQPLEKKVKDYYHIPKESGIILFAPTFRVYEFQNLMIEPAEVARACEKRFGKPFVFGYRMHKMILDNHYFADRKDEMLDFGEYEDVQELIAAADVMITDYSSIIWDAAIAKKPCFIFAPDLEQYNTKVGFDVPVSEWPFPLAKTNAELYEKIAAFDERTYRADCDAHLQALGSYETGHSAEQTIRLMNQLKNEASNE